jgi:hypothetical protein
VEPGEVGEVEGTSSSEITKSKPKASSEAAFSGASRGLLASPPPLRAHQQDGKEAPEQPRQARGESSSSNSSRCVHGKRVANICTHICIHMHMRISVNPCEILVNLHTPCLLLPASEIRNLVILTPLPVPLCIRFPSPPLFLPTYSMFLADSLSLSPLSRPSGSQPLR